MDSLQNVPLDSEIGNFTSGGISVEIAINHECIQWSFSNSSETEAKLKAKNKCLEWKDVVGVQSLAKNTKNLTESQQKTDTDFTQIKLSYIVKKEDHKWRCDHIIFEGDFSSWISRLRERIRQGKPRKLLVIINPIGGFGKGRQNYEKKVAPLFELADITTDVKVTERAGHTIDILKTYDFSTIDGIVSVGGDGLYHEVLNGILPMIQDDNIDYNDTEITLKSPPVPIGIIPTGTGNGIAGWSCGCIDIETSALHVIRGEHHKSCALSIKVGGKHLAFAGLLFSYGVMSDLIKKSEERRWMKVMRYPVSILGGFLGRQRTFNADVSYKTLNTNVDGEKKEDNCENDWKTIDLKEFLSVHVFCCDIRVDNGVVKFDRQSDSFLLMSYGRIKKMEQIKFLGRFATQSPNLMDFDWLIKNSNVTRFHIKVNESVDCGSSNERDRALELYVNIDGESIPISEPDIDVRFCSQLVPIYSSKF
ncbi:ceramide kinase [Patella vulgata]|uniref:ceramide kinase n=1 Tax=Patella vulgata TaxID=6465 RepID=UPI00217F24B2|nr:ceramide kinase [Patella vulgata]